MKPNLTPMVVMVPTMMFSPPPLGPSLQPPSNPLEPWFQPPPLPQPLHLPYPCGRTFRAWGCPLSFQVKSKSTLSPGFRPASMADGQKTSWLASAEISGEKMKENLAPNTLIVPEPFPAALPPAPPPAPSPPPVRFTRAAWGLPSLLTSKSNSTVSPSLSPDASQGGQNMSAVPISRANSGQSMKPNFDPIDVTFPDLRFSDCAPRPCILTFLACGFPWLLKCNSNETESPSLTLPSTVPGHHTSSP
mmetsp:Transcript_91771/g.230583  ORF Transcript_91771/g.230583 Transcript_91771/m.230583 type:complete len:247 (+) Transcript_91771:142-882(+)